MKRSNRDKTLILAGIALVLGLLLAYEIGPHIRGPEPISQWKIAFVAAEAEKKAINADIKQLVALVEQFRSGLAGQQQLQLQLQQATDALGQPASRHRRELTDRAQLQAGSPRILTAEEVDSFIIREIERLQMEITERRQAGAGLEARIKGQREALLQRADRLVDHSLVLQGKDAGAGQLIGTLPDGKVVGTGN